MSSGECQFKSSAYSPGGKFDVQGVLVGQDKIEGSFFNALGIGTFAASNYNGEWRGSWEADGECDGSIHLAKTRFSSSRHYGIV